MLEAFPQIPNGTVDVSPKRTQRRHVVLGERVVRAAGDPFLEGLERPAEMALCVVGSSHACVRSAHLVVQLNQATVFERVTR